MKIDFYSRDNCDFNPEILWGKGLGGAEYALVFLADALAEMGHDVTIWNNTSGEIRYGKVLYKNLRLCDFTEYRDLFVIWRVSIDIRPNARRIVFFSCDQGTDGNWLQMFSWINTFICISQFHQQYIALNYPLGCCPTEICELGVNIHDYMNLDPGEKIRNRMIFCSVPHRGLNILLNLWPRIKLEVPDASLVVTSDYTLWGRGNNPDNSRYRELAEGLQDVIFLGNVPRRELIVLQRQSEIMTYPCTYDENFCIAAMECIAAGCVPVVPPIAAITTTVGDSGIVLYDRVTENIGQEQFVKAVVHLATHQEEREQLAQEGITRARRDYSYEAVARRLLQASGLAE